MWTIGLDTAQAVHGGQLGLVGVEAPKERPLQKCVF